MGRKRRVWIPHAYHHIYTRGNNRQNIFHDDTDMRQVFRILAMIHTKFPIAICAFCIMTNHYHFLLKSEDVTISKIMGIFNKRYTDYYNRRYEHIGHVFQQRFNSSPVSYSQDLLKVSKYIHRNPINTKKPLVHQMEDYPYSSYQYYKVANSLPYPFINLHDLPASLLNLTDRNVNNYCKYVEKKDE
jgi:putative transposase